MPQEILKQEKDLSIEKFTDQITQTEEITFHPCEMCDSKFLNEETLKDHRYIHLQIRSDFKCRSCEKVYLRLSHLQRHISCVHPEIAAVKSLCIRQKCPVCNKQFARPDHYKRHIVEVHGYTSEAFSGLPTEMPFNFQHSILPDNFGEVMIKSEPNFGEAMIKSEPMEEYSEYLYPNVDQRYSEAPSSSIIPNEIKINDSFTLHSCDICKKPFDNLKQLAEHIRTECSVAAVRLHKCQKCEKSFKRPSHLRRHEITHLDVKPFKCDHCEKRFSRKEHLKIHFVGHHSKKLQMLEAICEIKKEAEFEAGESSTINETFFDANASL